MLTQLSEVIEAEYPKRMELFEVPVTDPDHRAAVRLMGVFTTPAVLVFAPSNAVTHHFKDFDDLSGELSKAFLSPKMEEIMAGLQQRKVIFVHVWPAQDTMYQQNREQLEGLAQLLSASVRVVYIQADASEEQQLLREVIKLDPAKEAPVTLVVSSQGAILEKIPGKLSRELLLKSFRKVLVSRSGCGGQGSGPGGGTCQ